ncbi:MAG: hypothetical protein ABJA67_15930 [Chthonomonadales bacterium]
MPDWEEPLSIEERDALIEKVANGVVKRGLQTPTVIFLEMNKPFSFIASQGLVVTSHVVAPFIGLENVQSISRLIADRNNIELLIRRIEDLTEENTRSKSLPQQPAAKQNQ